MHPEFLLLALVFLISVVHGVVQPRPHVRATPSGFKKRFQTLQSKLSLAGQDLRTNVPLYIKRTPSAVVGGIQGGASSFLSSLAVLLPIAIVLSIKPSYPRWKTIFANGLNTGVQWAGISGLFMGAETFSEKIRGGRKDMWNTCFGSGVSGAFAQVHQGPAGMTQGFVSGAVIIYALDKVMQTVQSSTPSTSSSTSPFKSNSNNRQKAASNNRKNNHNSNNKTNSNKKK